ncbi:unnamed protein product, partial [Thlaspi arvense]
LLAFRQIPALLAKLKHTAELPTLLDISGVDIPTHGSVSLADVHDAEFSTSNTNARRTRKKSVVLNATTTSPNEQSNDSFSHQLQQLTQQLHALTEKHNNLEQMSSKHNLRNLSSIRLRQSRKKKASSSQLPTGAVPTHTFPPTPPAIRLNPSQWTPPATTSAPPISPEYTLHRPSPPAKTNFSPLISQYGVERHNNQGADARDYVHPSTPTDVHTSFHKSPSTIEVILQPIHALRQNHAIITCHPQAASHNVVNHWLATDPPSTILPAELSDNYIQSVLKELSAHAAPPTGETALHPKTDTTTAAKSSNGQPLEGPDKEQVDNNVGDMAVVDKAVVDMTAVEGNSVENTTILGSNDVDCSVVDSQAQCEERGTTSKVLYSKVMDRNIVDKGVQSDHHGNVADHMLVDKDAVAVKSAKKVPLHSISADTLKANNDSVNMKTTVEGNSPIPVLTEQTPSPPKTKLYYRRNARRIVLEEETQELSNGSPPPTRQSHFPSQMETLLAYAMRKKTSPSRQYGFPINTLLLLGSAYTPFSNNSTHYTKDCGAFDNNFLLELAASKSWTSTRHMEVLMAWLRTKQTSMEEEEIISFCDPSLIGYFLAKQRKFSAAKAPKRLRWDELRPIAEAPGSRWVKDMQTLYEKKYWVGLAINISIGSIEILDPLPSLKDKRKIATWMRPICEMLPYAVNSLCTQASQGIGLTPYVWHVVQDIYVNARTGDCGLVAIKFMEMHAAGDPEPHMFGLTDAMVDDFRKQYAMDLYRDLVIPLYFNPTV